MPDEIYNNILLDLKEYIFYILNEQFDNDAICEKLIIKIYG
jgi:hypothetical protein